ncbi:MAG TPA: MauE/DoxX family redox-associated membrane protein [Jatrophihabitans sp.]|jgi:uncharacterized membrane protein YphA (DoxX/SURF4 family)|nr:MauE/DoxX family redox-associated membrane protein [Jatrophihabitans sp.]
MDYLSALAFCRWAIGLTFAVSALGKARSMTDFRAAIEDFGMLPRRAIGQVAAATVATEGLVVLLLALGRGWATAGFVLALALLAAFSAVLVAALRRKAAVSCNCFGTSQRPISFYDVARNGCLALCCLGGLWSRHAATGNAPEPALVLALALMAATFLVVVSNLEDIVELLRKPYVVD